MAHRPAAEPPEHRPHDPCGPLDFLERCRFSVRQDPKSDKVGRRGCRRRTYRHAVAESFVERDLEGSRFHRVDLTGASFERVKLRPTDADGRAPRPRRSPVARRGARGAGGSPWPRSRTSSPTSPTSSWLARPAGGRRRVARHPRSFPVREVLMVILDEEWWHRQFAERDLAALATR
jgi:hypothetical protein